MATRMLTSRTHASPDHRADHEWTACLASKHVAQFGSLVKDLIPADAEEIYKHQFGYWAHTGGSSADRCANEPGLRDGCIEDSIAPKLLDKAFSDAEYAAPCLIIL